MRFTTDTERYYFACAKKNNYEEMMNYCNEKIKELNRKRSQKAEDERTAYRQDYFYYLRKVNFWCDVRAYFEKKVDFGKGKFYEEGYLFTR